jgi:LPXTG-motif cell wall-anchored protein
VDPISSTVSTTGSSTGSSNGSSILILVAVLVIVLILFSLTRKRNAAAKYPEIVQSLLYDIRFNQGLAEHLPELKKPHRFENSNWMLNKEKIGFLGETLKEKLKENFGLVEEFNKQIKEAKKARSDSYKTIDLTRLKQLLGECRAELEDWMVEKTGSKDLPPKYPTISGMFFGER